MSNATAVHSKLLHSSLTTNSNFDTPTDLNLSDSEPDEPRSCSPDQLNELDSDSDVSSITDASADGENRSPSTRQPFAQCLVTDTTDGKNRDGENRSPSTRPPFAQQRLVADTFADGVKRSPSVQVQRLSVDQSSVGLLHPCIADSSGRRVPWTDNEISIVGTWCTRYKSQHPGNINVVAGCLRYILNDNDVRQQFHPHHVLDSTRLRWGWQKYQELRAGGF